MATARCTASNVVQPLFQVPLHMKAVIDAINIDNQGVAACTMQLEDDFTQDISNLNNVPTARSAFPFQATVPAGISFSADELSVKEIECLANVGALCSVVQPLTVITVQYHFE